MGFRTVPDGHDVQAVSGFGVFRMWFQMRSSVETLPQ